MESKYPTSHSFYDFEEFGKQEHEAGVQKFDKATKKVYSAIILVIIPIVITNLYITGKIQKKFLNVFNRIVASKKFLKILFINAHYRPACYPKL